MKTVPWFLALPVLVGAVATASPAQAQSRTCIQPENGGRPICGDRIEDVVCIQSPRYNGIVCGRRTYSTGRDQGGRDLGRNRGGRDIYDSDSGQSESGFDEQFYRLAYPDVDQAIAQGRVRSAYDHYVKLGRFEGRFPRFNEASYLSKNADVAAAVRRGEFRNGYAHWFKNGRFERRPI
jgi:hypothetical protein